MKHIMVMDDKQNYREKVRKIIESLEEKTYVFYIKSVSKAYEVAENNKIDLFLVDIVLQPGNPSDVSGLTFVENIRHMERYKYTPVILMSELEDPKLYAFRELRCFSYIHKPFENKELQNELQSALELPVAHTKTRMYFRNEGVLYFVNSDDIVYVEVIKRKLFIYTTSQRLTMSYETAKQFMQKMDDGRFVRCSRFVIVNMDYIERVDFTNRYVQMKGMERMLEIGTAIKERFKEELAMRGAILN